MLRWLLLTLCVCTLTPSCAWLDDELMLDDEAYAATFGEETSTSQTIDLDAMHLFGCGFGGLGIRGIGYSGSGYGIGRSGHSFRYRHRVRRGVVAPGGSASASLHVREEKEEVAPVAIDGFTEAATRGSRHIVERDQERHKALAAWVMENVEAQ